jgi:hypothetical protein
LAGFDTFLLQLPEEWMMANHAVAAINRESRLNGWETLDLGCIGVAVNALFPL